MIPLPSERDLYMMPLPELRGLLDRTIAVLCGRLRPQEHESDLRLLGVLAEVLESCDLPGRDALEPAEARPVARLKPLLDGEDHRKPRNGPEIAP